MYKSRFIITADNSLHEPFKDEAQIDLFKDPAPTAQ